MISIDVSDSRVKSRTVKEGYSNLDTALTHQIASI